MAAVLGAAGGLSCCSLASCAAPVSVKIILSANLNISLHILILLRCFNYVVLHYINYTTS